MPSWRALAAKARREVRVLIVTGHALPPICRLMPTGAAYGPTRVAVATYAVHPGIRPNERADPRRPALGQIHPYRARIGGELIQRLI